MQFTHLLVAGEATGSQEDAVMRANTDILTAVVDDGTNH
jgi:hypothetical protein